MTTGMLGLGSNNVLNSDLINKLKAAEEKTQKTLYTKRVEADDTKLDSLASIKKAVDEFKDSVEELGNIKNYNAVNISGNNTVDAKITNVDLAEDFSLEVTQKARKGIIQSNTFSDKSDALTSDQTLVFSIGNGGDRTINFSAGDTYEDIVKRLNLEAGIDVSVIKVDKDNFRLSVSTEKTGLDNKINIKSETDGLKSFIGLSKTENNIQDSQNSKFIYNGIKIERDNNNIKDVVSGVEFTIRNIGTNNISINPNGEALTSSITNMVEKYNNIVKEIKKTNNSDNYLDSLNSNTEIRNIMRSINKSLFSTNNLSNNSFSSISDLGIISQKDGTIAIKTTTNQFGEKVGLQELSETHFNDIKMLFAGTNKEGVSIGIMNKTYENALEKLTNSKNNGGLDTLKLNIEKDKDRLNKQLEKTQAKIDKQYELMSKKFAAFDALIQKANSAFSSLELQIKQSTASPNS